jgi:hypothetical protein
VPAGWVCDRVGILPQTRAIVQGHLRVNYGQVQGTVVKRRNDSDRGGIVFCFDLIIVIFSALRTATTAHRKGWSGLLFGIVHAMVVMASEGAGVMTGLFIGFKNDPFLDKQTAMKPMLFGAGGGLAFGIILMLIVIGLLPPKTSKEKQNRRFRALESDDVSV